MVVGLQQSCGLGIPDDLRDLFADEIGGGVVGGLVDGKVVVDRHEGEAAAVPARFVFRAPFVLAVVERAAVGHLRIDAVARLLAREAPDFRIVGAKRLALLRRQRRIAGGNRKIRRALKHRELARLLGDDRHRLDRRRARADDADAQAREIDRLMRPVAGVIDLALEFLQPLDIGHPRIRQAAGGEHDVFCGDGLAVGCRHRPAVGALVEGGAIDAGIELNVGAQIKAVGDVVGVFQDLGLRRVALAPVPFLLQFFGERIGILHALDVAARAGITVPVPGAADVAALLVDADRKTLPAQPVQHIHAGKACADHDDIVGLGVLGAVSCRKRIARRTFELPRYFSAIAGQHSTAAAKAQETKRQAGAAYFAARNAPRASTSAGVCTQDLTGRNRLGFGARDRLASPENLAIRTNNKPCRKGRRREWRQP